MIEKDFYVAPNMEIILYSEDDIVRTSNVESEVGGGWEEGWGKSQEE